MKMLFQSILSKTLASALGTLIGSAYLSSHAQGHHFSNSRTYPGSYSVPVHSPAAQNPMGLIQITDTVGNPRLRYELPEDLVGQKYMMTELQLQQKRRTPQGWELNWTSDRAEALCLGKSDGMECRVKYPQMRLNQYQQTSFLRRKYSLQPQLLAQKLRVARSFSADPIGILKIQCDRPLCGL